MNRQDQADLARIADQAMRDRGLAADFPPDVMKEVSVLREADFDRERHDAVDLRKLNWCSIDNDDSRDLDQLTVSEDAGGGRTRLMIAVADVDALVKKNSAIDRHAQTNTTSVYTAAKIFPMLPERLSTDLTSLNSDEERLAMIIDITVDEDGNIVESDVYRGIVHNKAKLAYPSVGAWLEGDAEPPPLVVKQGLEEELRRQDRAAQLLRRRRYEEGALELETLEPRAIVEGGRVKDLELVYKNRARDLIEDCMVAANGVTARFLQKRNFPTFRRVVRSPERWGRIREIAEKYGETLPPEPDSRALADFLASRRKADRLRFPDLSLTIIKLMGAGEYAVELPNQKSTGHFGLAVRDYSHSTAPNRRYPDLITHRLLKAALAGKQPPYSNEELEELAAHCTNREDDANKVERLVRKAAAAQLLEDRIDQRFDGIVTGASSKGTWVRIFKPPVEGRVVHGWDGMDVGEKVRVKLIGVDVEKGHIDFVGLRND